MTFKAAEGELADHGYSLHLVNTGGRPAREAEAMDALQSGRVDGLIITINSEREPRTLDRLRKLRVPAVLLDRHVPIAIDAVLTDHAFGMEQAVDYLYDIGHRRIALITAGQEILPGRERIRGFVQACERRGVAMPRHFIRSRGLSADAGYREATELLRLPDGPTAMIIGGNQLLVGVLKAVQQQGITIPAGLSLIACDKTDLSSVYAGGMTIIDRDIDEIGRAAAQLLLERIAGSRDRPARSISFPTKLIIGRSCAPLAA
jgi:LacI family transcriptional regulator